MDREDNVADFLPKLSEIKTKNPLFMEDILPHIFHYLPLRDLSVCSKICHFWRQIAWGQIILENEILFRNIKEVQDYITTFKNNKSKRQRFEPIPSSSSSSSSIQSILKPVPFKNYKFYLDWENMVEVAPIRNEHDQHQEGQDNISINKTDTVMEKGAVLQEFFINFHKYIYSLDIHKSSSLILPISVVQQQKEQYSSNNNNNIFPNLKNLCLNINQLLNNEELLLFNNQQNIFTRLESLKLCCNNIKSKDLPQIIQFLQQTTIKLKSLKLQVPTAICNNNNQLIKNISKDLLDYLINVYKLDRLDNFNYKFPIDSTDLSMLTKYKLTNFKSISLRLADNNNNNSNFNAADSLYKFLESLIQIENLYLKFINWWNPDLPKQLFPFPYLHFLKKLKLKNYRGDLKFLINNCPNLNELEILFWRAEIQYITTVNNSNNNNNDRPLLYYNKDIQNIKLLPILLHSRNVILVNPPEESLNSVSSLVVELAGFPNHFIVLEYLTTMFPNLNKFQYDANVSVSEKSQLSEYIKEKLPQLNSLFIQKIPKKVFLQDFSHSVHVNEM